MAESITFADISGIVLAGGLSTRMGQDKALLPFEGKPLVTRTVDKLQELFEEVIVVTNSEKTRAVVEVKTTTDIIPQQGPLSGIHAGLTAMSEQRGFFVACDMPMLNSDLIRYMSELAQDYDVVAPRIDGNVEGMHAVYSKNCIAPIERALRDGRRKLIGFYGEVQVRYVERQECERFDPQLRMFENVNTPDELERAVGALANLKSQPANNPTSKLPC